MNKKTIIGITAVFLIAFSIGVTANSLWKDVDFGSVRVHETLTVDKEAEFKETTGFGQEVLFNGLVAYRNRIIIEESAEIYACGQLAYTGVCPSSWNREFCDGVLIRCWMD